MDVFALCAAFTRARGVDGHGQVGRQCLTPVADRCAWPTLGARAEARAARVGVAVGVRPALRH